MKLIFLKSHGQVEYERGNILELKELREKN